MSEGIIKFYKEDKGWGFISFGNNEEVFFHFSNIKDENKKLYRGEYVLFEIIDTVRGKMAVNVQRKKDDSVDS